LRGKVYITAVEALKEEHPGLSATASGSDRTEPDILG
jgi:hypothetical protein